MWFSDLHLDLIESRPRKPDRTTIVHLSDLHFDSTTNWSQPPFSAFMSDLQQLSAPPDLVICTGDLIDASVGDSRSPARLNEALVRARQFLEAACATCSLDPHTALFVVPGNHDYRIKGLFGSSVLKDAFLECFILYFRNRVLPGLNLLLYSFDSNSADWTVNLATGFVDQQEFVHFQDWLTRYAGFTRFNALTKVALLHHHPMPIAETEGRGRRDPSQFMILRNAATFMKAIVKEGFDLVLHGHQHLIGYARATFPLREDEILADRERDRTREVAVIAAGSAGEPNEGNYRSHNVISVRNNGPTEVEQRIVRESLYDRGPRFRVPSTYGEWRRNRALHLAESPEVVIKGDTVNAELVIDSAGDCERSNVMMGMRSHGAESRSSIPSISLSAVANFGPPTAACLNDSNRTVQIQPVEGGQIRDGMIRYEITFTPPLSEADQLDIETRRAAFNSFFFCAQDRSDVLPRSAVGGSSINSAPITEKAGWRSIGLFDSVSISVKLPSNVKIEAPRAEVTSIERPSEVDRAESDYCTRHLIYRPETTSALLTVDYPLPLHDYWIVWGLPDEPLMEFDIAEQAQIEEIEAVWAGSHEANKSRISAALGELRAAIAKRFSLANPSTDVDIALMHFDPKPHARRLTTFAALYPADDPIYRWSPRKGQSIEGQALRRRADLVGFKNDGIWKHYYVCPEGCQEDLFVLASPLTYPLNSNRVIGLVRVATRSGSSELLHLQRDAATQRELGELVHKHYIRAILPIVLPRKDYAVLRDSSISYFTVEECLN